MLRKILFSSITSVVMTTLLSFYFKPRYIEIFEMQQLELSNARFMFIFLLDAVICCYLAVLLYNFLEAVITPKSHVVIVEKCIYFFAAVISFSIYFLVRSAFSNPNWIVLSRHNPDLYIFDSWLTPLGFAFLFFMSFSDVESSRRLLEQWFADKNTKTETTTVSEVLIDELEKAEEAHTDIEIAYNLESMQVRLQKATELYESVQTEEAKQQAQAIIDRMNETITYYTGNVIAQKDQMILAEMQKQQRINDELMEEA